MFLPKLRAAGSSPVYRSTKKYANNQAVKCLNVGVFFCVVLRSNIGIVLLFTTIYPLLLTGKSKN